MRYLLILLIFTYQFSSAKTLCKIESYTISPSNLLLNDGDLEIESNFSSLEENNLILKGNVTLRSKELYLESNNISIDKASKDINSTGRSKALYLDSMILGENLVLNPEKKLLNVKNVDFTDNNLGINGAAKNIFLDENYLQVDDGQVSSCIEKNKLWSLNAKNILFNKSENLAMAEDLYIQVYDVPIFYLPSLEWSLKNRKSGFLAPKFNLYDDSNSNKSTKISVPYYFNISPDKDLLLKVNNLSSRGVLIGNKYRQLIKNLNDKYSLLTLEADFLNNDKISRKKRWYINNSGEFQINHNAKFSFINNRVSDSDYFKEIHHSNTSLDSLNSRFLFEYQDDKKLEGSLIYESEQLVNNGSPAYTKRPGIKISKLIEDGPNQISIDFYADEFKNADSNKQTGKRFHSEIGISREYHNQNLILNPNFILRNSMYDIDNTKNINRNIFSIGFESKYPLERDIKFNNSDIIQTLTPRLSYNYTSRDIQNTIPLFDSEQTNIYYENLFSGSKFTGFDRISNDNSITFGLESDFLNANSSDTFLSLGIGQKIFFNDSQLNIEGELSNTEKSGNIYTSANLHYYDVLFGNSIEYNANNNTIESSNTTIEYSNNKNQNISISLLSKEEETLDLFFATPIHERLNFYSGINRTLSTSTTNKAYGGIEYSSCCASLRVSHSSVHLGNDSYDNVTSFDVVFDGLSSSGENQTTNNFAKFRK